jgi:adenosylmethionine-8-amino-7-oxononanoate aminotransferase
MCLAKGLTGGYLPLAATLATERVYEGFLGAFEQFRTFFHGHTYTGNPLACAAALANLDELERLDALGRVRAREDFLGSRLRALRGHANVRDVRGVGFLWAVEFAHAAFANRVVVRGLATGVILLQSGPTGTSITIAPPLTIADDQLARALDLFEAAVHTAEEHS